jgi:hypothetical protein
MKRLAMMLLVTACSSGGKGGGGDDGVTLPDGQGGGPRPTIDYQSFTTRTRSIGVAGDRHMVSLTDNVGPVACGLSKDHHNGLGTAGHQLLMEIGYANSVCPTGTHSIKSGCTTDLGFLPSVPEGCAYYRRFDATAKELGIVAASAGAVQVTGTEASCTFTVNLSFAGQAYTDTFTLTNGLVADPWCK